MFTCWNFVAGAWKYSVGLGFYKFHVNKQRRTLQEELIMKVFSFSSNMKNITVNIRGEYWNIILFWDMIHLKDHNMPFFFFYLCMLWKALLIIQPYVFWNYIPVECLLLFVLCICLLGFLVKVLYLVIRIDFFFLS